MEVFQRVGELLGWQVIDQAVEHSEPVAHLAGMAAVADHVTGGGCTDVGDRSPELTVLFDPGGSFLSAGNHPGDFPAPSLQFRRRRGQPLLHVITEGLKIPHHKIRTVEHGGVQPLHHECACF
ncbi:MAG: Uncharacterised protein [Cyanobium sp. ARS6]|nr:MAG: Uncharacterised protein [Cyanobium sp. ARS6]